MDRGAWWAVFNRVTKELDTTEQLSSRVHAHTHTHTHIHPIFAREFSVLENILSLIFVTVLCEVFLKAFEERVL